MSVLSRLFGRREEHAPSHSVPPGQRIYAIGDVHGRADLLGRMMGLIAEDLTRAPAADTLTVFLGDYVDRGSGSRAVLETLCGGAFPTSAVTIRGNHEIMLLNFLADPSTGEVWIRNGGLETLHSYGLDVRPLRSGQGYYEAADTFRDTLPATHLEFLMGTVPHHAAGDFFFCHAGARPGVPLEQQTEEDLAWIREPFLTSDFNFGKMIVHGHTPAEHPEIRPNRINIDTGAYISGRLTCLVLEEDRRRFLQTGASVR